MAKRDEKHSMAEDYLARIKWEGEHPYRKGVRPPEPDWKYRPVYSRNSSPSKTWFGIVLLFALIVVAGLAIFQMVTTSHVDASWLIVVIILLSIILFVTRKPKRPTDD